MTEPAPPGIDLESVTRWCAENSPLRGPLEFEAIAGGHSNLTYLVTDSTGGRSVLRRPPLGSVLATAHDMSREWRAVHALQHTSVPVPPAIAFCGDDTVTGAPFYVTGFVEGRVMHNKDVAALFTPEQRRISALSLFDVLADMHAIDIDAVGLGEHGPRKSSGGTYVERQLNRWYKQFTASLRPELGDGVALAEAYARLSRSLPTNPATTLAHGDYRLGNCITFFDGPIAAVLDWEISTLGDPLADLSYLLNTWTRPGDAAEQADGSTAPSLLEGFPERDELTQRYAVRSGRDVSDLSWYLAFNHFKSACIIGGVLARYLEGARGAIPPEEELAAFRMTLDFRAESSLAALNA